MVQKPEPSHLKRLSEDLESEPEAINANGFLKL